MTVLTWGHVYDLCLGKRVDPAYVDPSLTYGEILDELGKNGLGPEGPSCWEANGSDPAYLEHLQNGGREDDCPEREVHERERVRPICPRCGKPGSGIYVKTTGNARGGVYRKYRYFAHREGKRTRWCYLGV